MASCSIVGREPLGKTVEINDQNADKHCLGNILLGSALFDRLVNKGPILILAGFETLMAPEKKANENSKKIQSRGHWISFDSIDSGID